MVGGAEMVQLVEANEDEGLDVGVFSFEGLAEMALQQEFQPVEPPQRAKTQLFRKALVLLQFQSRQTARQRRVQGRAGVQHPSEDLRRGRSGVLHRQTRAVVHVVARAASAAPRIGSNSRGRPW